MQGQRARCKTNTPALRIEEERKNDGKRKQEVQLAQPQARTCFSSVNLGPSARRHARKYKKKSVLSLKKVMELKFKCAQGQEYL